jgi:hypothetical protein
MKSQYVAFIIRIRFDESRPGFSASSNLHGAIHQAGSSQMHPFDTFDRLVDILHKAIAGLASGNPDAPKKEEEE